jgi:hypothetical protein
LVKDRSKAYQIRVSKILSLLPNNSFIYRLPGQSPESYIYDKVVEKLNEVSGELAVALLRPYEEEAKVADIVRSVRNTNRDTH